MPSSTPLPPPFRIAPGDPEYIADARAEGEFFDKPQYFGTKLAIALPADSPLEAYANRRFTGDPNLRWYDSIPSYGHFKTGLFFGVSDVEFESHILKSNPDLSVTFLDISEESLEARERVLSKRFPGRVQTQLADLNFAELEPDKYDLIISFSVLHHLQNIEWIAYQLNRALLPGGYFVLNDYVGENRFQFSTSRRSILEGLIGRAKRRGDVPPSWTIPWPALDPWVYSPFEAIRCEDTLDILGQHLQPVHVSGTGSISPLLIIVSMSPEDARRYISVQELLWRRRPYSLARQLATRIGLRRIPAMNKHFFEDLTLLDSICIDSGLLTPLVAFAVYRKRA